MKTKNSSNRPSCNDRNSTLLLRVIGIRDTEVKNATGCKIFGGKIIGIVTIINNKQSLRGKHPSRKYVVFGEVFHNNKKSKNIKNKKYKCHRSN